MSNTAPSPARDSVRLAEGLQFLGQYQGSGTAEEQYLLRRRDGQVLVVSRLLYAVVAAAEIEVDINLIAAEATAFVDRTVSPGNVAYLVERPWTVHLPAGRNPRFLGPAVCGNREG